MTGSGGKYCLSLGLILALVVAAALPAQAEFTKLYRFSNNTASDKGGVRAVTNGMEVITGDFVAPTGWGDPTVANILLSGAYCTKLKWTGGAVESGSGPVKVGWSTSDNSCRLRDLRWVTTAGNLAGPVVDPEVLQQAVPGGGQSFYDPDTGNLIVVITNDTDGDIYLAGTQFAVSDTPLGLSDLDYVAEVGLVGLRVAAIEEDIGALAAAVSAAQTAGDIPNPAARSLLRKLERAIQHLAAALARWQVGDDEGALVFRDRAAKQMKNLISEVTNHSKKGNIPQDLASAWIAAADEIRAAILALPEGAVLQELPGATPPIVPPGFTPDDFRPWPVEVLEVGCYTAYVLAGVTPEAGLVLQGSVLDAAGNSVLDWVEQATATEEALDTTPPEIIAATVDPNELWPPDHERVEMSLAVTVTDEDDAGNSRPSAWYIEGVSSNQPVDGSGDGDSSPAAVPVGGRAVEIVFSLASAGEVQAEVLNIAGRRIKTIVADRKSEKGTTSLIWNCQNERGLAVPAGTYLIRLTARTKDGQQAAALCPVTLRP